MLKLRFESISLVTSHTTLKTLPVVQRDRRRIDFGFRSTLDGRRVRVRGDFVVRGTKIAKYQISNSNPRAFLQFICF